MKTITQPKIHSDSLTSVARIATNSAFTFSARALDVVMRIILIAITARYLGTKEFGEYAFVMAIATFLIPLLDFGIERIIVREISNDIENADKYVASALILRMIFSIIIIIPIISFTHIFHWGQQTILAIYIAMCSQVFVAFGMVFLGIFRSFERMEYDTLSSFIHQSIRLICLIAVVKYDFGFLYVFLTIAVADLSKTLLQVIIVSMKFVKFRLITSINRCKLLLKESYPIGVFALLTMMSFKLDIFVLKYFRGPVEISLFAVPHTLISQIQIIPMSIVIALFPVLARLSRSSKSSFAYAYENAYKFLLNVSLPITIIIIIWAKEIIIAAFGKEYSDASLSLQIFAGTVSFRFLTSLMNITLISADKQIMITVIMGITLCVNLLMNLILVPKYGYIGASIATFIAHLCFFCIDLYVTSKNACSIPITSISSKAVVCGISMCFGCFIFKCETVVSFVAGVTLGILCYGFTMIVLKTFTREEVNLLKRAIVNRA